MKKNKAQAYDWVTVSNAQNQEECEKAEKYVKELHRMSELYENYLFEGRYTNTCANIVAECNKLINDSNSFIQPKPWCKFTLGLKLVRTYELIGFSKKDAYAMALKNKIKIFFKLIGNYLNIYRK